MIDRASGTSGLVLVSSMASSGGSAVLSYLKTHQGVFLPAGSEPKVLQGVLRLYRWRREGARIKRSAIEDAIGQAFGSPTVESGDLYVKKREKFLKSIGRSWDEWLPVARMINAGIDEITASRSSRGEEAKSRVLMRCEKRLSEAIRAFESLVQRQNEAVLLDNLYRFDKDALGWTRKFRSARLIGVHRDPRDHLAERRRRGSRISAENFVKRYMDSVGDMELPRDAVRQAGDDAVYVPFESFALSLAVRQEVARFAGILEPYQSSPDFSESRAFDSLGIWKSWLTSKEVEVIERSLEGYFRASVN